MSLLDQHDHEKRHLKVKNDHEKVLLERDYNQRGSFF